MVYERNPIKNNIIKTAPVTDSCTSTQRRSRSTAERVVVIATKVTETASFANCENILSKQPRPRSFLATTHRRCLPMSA